MKFLVLLGLVGLVAASPRIRRDAPPPTNTNNNFLPADILSSILNQINTFTQPQPVQSNGNRADGTPAASGSGGFALPSPFNLINGIIPGNLNQFFSPVNNVFNQTQGIVQNTISNVLNTVNGFGGNALGGLSGSGSASTGSPAPTRDNGVFKCNPIEPKLSNMARDENLLITYPAHTQTYKVGDSDKDQVAQVTYGYSMDGNTFIHSVLAGNASTMKNFVQNNMDRVTQPLTPGARSDEQFVAQPLLDAALTEFGLLSLTNLASNMIKSVSSSLQVSAALDCQFESFQCMLKYRETPKDIEFCSESLCSCLKQVFTTESQ